MNKETELKFKLTKLPMDRSPNLNKIEPDTITQTYLVSTATLQKYLNEFLKCEIKWNNIKEIRLRKRENSKSINYYLTLKSDGTLERDEYDVVIKLEDYENFLSFELEGTLYKKRYTVDLPETNLKLELDEYTNQLEGLLIAEIEYKKNEYPNNSQLFEKAKLFLGSDIIDVTDDKNYKNRMLVLR